MATTWKIGVDWRRKGLICWDAQPGDALNILPQPIRYTTLAWRTNTATSIMRQTQPTDYGQNLFIVQSGTGVNNGFVLGQSDASAVDTIPVSPSTAYSVSVRVKGISGYSGVPVILRVKDQSGATLVTSSPLTLSADWQILSVNFTTGASASHIMLEVIKDNDATDVLFHVAGVMLVAGSTMPSGYNSGNTADLYDSISDLVLNADWVLGFERPYQDLADGTVLKLTLNNKDKWFSPEYAPGNGNNPLEGFVRPLRPMAVRSDDGTTVRTHWYGWLESVQPTTNKYGERTARIKASGAERFFSNVETAVEIQQNKRTDEILERLLQEVTIPPALHMTTLPDVTGYNEIDSSAWITGDTTVERTLDTGKTTLAYAADNWVRQGAEGDQPDTYNVYRAMKDTVAAERGRFFFNREGRAIFWHRHNTITNLTLQATFNDAMNDLAYDYANQGEFNNDITVTCHPRTISAGENELLWQLDEPFKLQPGDEREIGASYRDESDNRIGGLNVQLANVTYNTGANFSPLKVVFKEKGANRSLLLVRNEGNKVAELQTCEIRGQKITDFGRADANVIDHESIALYGHREMTLNIQALDNQDDAQAIADFELIRRKNPSGKMQSLTLRSHGKNGGNQHTHQLARTIGDRIKIIESQTGHTGEYFIIGEEHKLSEQATLYETTWYLESATEGDWFVIDTDEVNSSAVLIPY